MEPKFILSDVFKAAWKGTRSQLWILAGLLIGYGILFFTLVAFAMPMQSSMAGMIVVNVISVLFSCLFSLGYMKNIFQALDGEEPQFSAYGQQTRNSSWERSYSSVARSSSCRVSIWPYAFNFSGRRL